MKKYGSLFRKILLKNLNWRNNIHGAYKAVAVEWNHWGALKTLMPGSQPERFWCNGLEGAAWASGWLETFQVLLTCSQGWETLLTREDQNLFPVWYCIICLLMIWVNMWMSGYQIGGWNQCPRSIGSCCPRESLGWNCHSLPGVPSFLALEVSLSFLKNLFIYLFCYLFIYLWQHWVFVAACGSFSSCGERGLLFVVVHRLLIAVASLVAEHGL